MGKGKLIIMNEKWKCVRFLREIKPSKCSSTLPENQDSVERLEVVF